jgi:hypothetical protein
MYEIMINDIDIWPPHEVFYIESMLTITRTAMANLAQLQYCLDELFEDRNVDDGKIIDFVQSLISSAGALSRYFWPSNKKELHRNRGNKLRASFGITDNNPLQDRKVRNFVEHFDENLDLYLSKILSGTIIPTYVGYKPLENQIKPSFFRAYYLEESTFCVLDIEYDILPIVKELTRLHKLLLKAIEDGGRLPD